MTDRTAPALGVDIGATKLLVLLVDHDGRILDSRRAPTDAAAGPDAVMDTVVQALVGLRASSPRAPVAVGVGVAAQVDREGVARFAPNLRWVNRPLREELERRVGLPVRAVNDARAAAVGEWVHGAGRGESDLVCLFLGTGLGGGVVTGDHLLEGASNGGGELGHLTIVTGGRTCTCGNRGCLEAYVGGWAIAQRAREAAARTPGPAHELLRAVGSTPERITSELVVSLAASGDPFSRGLMEDTRHYLAAGLVGIVNAFNPRLIVYGGGVLEGAPTLLPEALEEARPSMLPSLGEVARAAKAILGANAVAVGAATFARGWAR